MDKTDIGALWVRTKDGKEYMTGVVTIGEVAHQIVVFKNEYKKAPNQPDWRVYKSAPRVETTEPVVDASTGETEVPF